MYARLRKSRALWVLVFVACAFAFSVAGSLGLFGCTYCSPTYCANGAKDPKCYVAPQACLRGDERDAGR